MSEWLMGIMVTVSDPELVEIPFIIGAMAGLHMHRKKALGEKTALF